MTTHDCPPDDELRAYLDEALPPEGTRTVDEHLPGCDRCLVALERLLDIPSRTIREALAMAAWTSGEGSTVAWPPGSEAPRRNLLIGARIGPYRIDLYLDGGAMGDVYLAHDVDFPGHGAPRDDGTDMDGAGVIRRWVAIKFIKTGRDGVEMIREFYSNAALGTHPNIAALFHTGSTDDGLPYLVMEYVRGGLPIDRYCKGLTIRDRVRLFLSVLEGVQHAHKHLIVHLDLKPGNILVTNDGVPKLVDFGVARLLERHAAGAPGPIGQAEGLTWEYASPEQARRAARLIGHSRGDPAVAGEAGDSGRDHDGGRVASDVYSLGVVLHELLTGHRLNQFRGKAIAEKVRTICEKESEPPSRVAARPGDQRRAIPADLDKIVAKALAKDPERRFESAREFSNALRDWLDSRPVWIEPYPTLPTRIRLWCRRNPAVAILSGIVAALLVVAATSLVRLAAARQEKLEEGLRFASREIAGHVRSRLDELSNPLRATATEMELKELLRRPDDGRLQLFADETLADFNRLFGAPDEPVFRSLFALDRDGQLVAIAAISPSKEDLLGTDLSFRDFFRHHERHQDISAYVSRVYKSEIDNFYKFAISVAVRDDDGALLGIIAATLSTASELGSRPLTEELTAVLAGRLDPRRPDERPPLPAASGRDQGEGRSDYVAFIHPEYGGDFPREVAPLPDGSLLSIDGSVQAVARDYKDPVLGGRWVAVSTRVNENFVVIVEQRK